MPYKWQYKQLRNTWLIVTEEKKKQKIEKISNNAIIVQSFVYHNQLCHNDTNNIDDIKRVDIWFGNSNINKLFFDLEEKTEVGEKQLNEKELDIDIKKPRIEKAVPLCNAVKEIKQHKDKENNLRSDYKKKSKLINKKNKKVMKKLEKHRLKIYNIRAF